MPDPAIAHQDAENRRPDWVEIALVLALITLSIPFVLNATYAPDEFFFLAGGRRIAAGEVPYRDFFQLLPPGILYTAAALIHTFGLSVIGPRVIQQGGLIVAGVLFYRSARRLGASRGLAVLPAITPILALERFMPHYTHHWLVMPWLALATYGCIWGLESARRLPWALAGLGAGTAIFFLQSDGLVMAIALATVLVLDAWMRPQRGGWPALALAIGFCTPLALWAAYFASQGALGIAIYDIWVWPLAQYRVPGSSNDIKFASDLWVNVSPFVMFMNLPSLYIKITHFLSLFILTVGSAIGGLAWGLGVLVRRIKGQSWSAQEAAFALVSLLCIGCLLTAARGRADVIHVAKYAWPAVLWLTVVAAAIARRYNRSPFRLVGWLPGGLLVAFVASGAWMLGMDGVREPGIWRHGHLPDTVYRQSPDVAYLLQHQRPGDRVVGFPFGGLYAFYGPPSIGPQDYVTAPEMGYQSLAEYRAFWDALIRNQPRFVVYTPLNDPEAERPLYFRWPLTGYRRVATLQDPTGKHVEIYEREAKQKEQGS